MFFSGLSLTKESILHAEIYVKKDNTAMTRACFHLNVTAMAERVTFKNVFKGVKKYTTSSWKQV
jgi:hypothetical protein